MAPHSEPLSFEGGDVELSDGHPAAPVSNPPPCARLERRQDSGMSNVTTGQRLFSLAGRIALVTGASRGLGLAMAEGLAEAGAVVALNGRNADALNGVASALCGRGLKAEIAPFDVTDQQAGKNAIETIIMRHGRLDILVANAGINHRVPLADWTPVDWDRLLTANLKACFFLAQQVAVPMREQGHGRIIFTTSIASIQARTAIHGYAA